MARERARRPATATQQRHAWQVAKTFAVMRPRTEVVEPWTLFLCPQCGRTYRTPEGRRDLPDGICFPRGTSPDAP